MPKFLALAFAFVCILAGPVLAQEPAFAVGQKWTIKDSGITIVIGAIEPFAAGKTAISISVFGVPCPPAMGCATTNVAHAPFDSEALARSVDKFVETNAALAPAFQEGYANWKNAKGGIFTVPVSQLPALLFQAIDTGKPVKSPDNI
jgi:hypothetical protein